MRINKVVQPITTKINKACKKVSKYMSRTQKTSQLKNDAVEFKSALCRSRLVTEKIRSFGFIEDYVSVEKEYIPQTKERTVYQCGKKYIIPSKPAHYEENYYIKPHYYIDELYSRSKGSGTIAVQNVVKQSLKNPQTNGRVILTAECIDGGKTYPTGFYYKLGFRSTDPSINEILRKWLNAGGDRATAPRLPGSMYLPKENIKHCLKYGK
ncbi:MAG: hypothetical protein LKG27_05525 [Clostridiaceae bacterium]|jgi:hypothetical protein|nr:hypothetical protein [Clostridiaceae bacterium]